MGETPHMVNITVDKKSAEAATVLATAENVSDPFTFAVGERDTGAILFLGWVTDLHE
ncbi:MAG TPA: hypothetical protein VJ827_12180 [Rubrobacter sp.]|nr:hypothetical protein [Rubrobacter sp.]